MNELKRCWKINRYVEKKNAFENLQVNFQIWLGLKDPTTEDIQMQEEQLARIHIAQLITYLLLEKNPYEIKMKIKENELIQKWFDIYEINENHLTKENVNILFEILKMI